MSRGVRPYLDKSHPEIFTAMRQVSREVRKATDEAGLGRDLVELVNVRVSQLNGCGACLSIHVPAAEAVGVDPVKLQVLPAWRDSDLFTETEKACLEVAEALTVRSGPSAILDGQDRGKAALQASAVLSTTQLAVIEWVVITINAFNRVSIASGHTELRR